MKTKTKSVWAGIWVNRALISLYKFQDMDLIEASRRTMQLFRAERFYGFAKFDKLLLSSPTQAAKNIIAGLGIDRCFQGIHPFNFTRKEPPYWVKDLPFEQLIKDGVIKDPAIIAEGMTAVVRASNHYRFAATKSALR
jgi:hypothetical protein